MFLVSFNSRLLFLFSHKVLAVLRNEKKKKKQKQKKCVLLFAWVLFYPGPLDVPLKTSPMHA
jgi:hypothetical protein